jgi:hypothetical protein
VPTFCRHNRFVERCPICREQAKPPGASGPGAAASGARSRPKAAAGRRAPAGGAPGRRAGQLRIRRVPRANVDDFSSPLVPGLRASGDARRLACELAFAGGRLAALALDPPGSYARVLTQPDVDRAAALAFLIVYLAPVEVSAAVGGSAGLGGSSASEGSAAVGGTEASGDSAPMGDPDPFEAIDQHAAVWEQGGLPDLSAARTGPRTSHDPARGTRTLEAFRAWTARAGSARAAFTGDPAWSAERRFDRVFERLALPGLHRAGRYELLVVLGRLGRFELRASGLRFDGADETSVGAKRVFGIGEPRLLERRAADLAAACEIPLEALDLGLASWQRAERVHAGFGDAVADPDAEARALAALGL